MCEPDLTDDALGQSLLYALDVWRNARSPLGEDAFPSTAFRVPTASGWIPADEAFFGRGWAGEDEWLDDLWCCCSTEPRTLRTCRTWPGRSFSGLRLGSATGRNATRCGSSWSVRASGTACGRRGLACAVEADRGGAQTTPPASILQLCRNGCPARSARRGCKLPRRSRGKGRATSTWTTRSPKSPAAGAARLEHAPGSRPRALRRAAARRPRSVGRRRPPCAVLPA